MLTYVIEGSGTYDFGDDPPAPVLAGAAHLLTAPRSVSHRITPGTGKTVRWFAVVATLPRVPAALPRLQSGRVDITGARPEGTIVRPLIGPGAAITSVVGLACEAIEFSSAGATFRKVGHDRVAVCYALSGRGAVDNQALDTGEAALVDGASGIAIEGRAGLRVLLTSAPRPP